MNKEILSALESKVNGVIYNPFVNLKDLVKAIIAVLSETDGYTAEIERLCVAEKALDEFESLSYGNLERIKGFNKTKNTILKVVKEVLIATGKLS
jgi:hypothetical protein